MNIDFSKLLGIDRQIQRVKDAAERLTRKATFWKEETDLYVLGSSILWGQGLLDEQKIHHHVRLWLEKSLSERVHVHLLAHSGAQIGTPSAGPPKPLFGEVPTPRPTLSEQIDLCPLTVGRKVRVLIEAGINDVGGSRILNPGTTESSISKLTRRCCGDDLLGVLRQLTGKLPSAEVFVLGYYPILATPADPDEVDRVLNAEGIDESEREAGFGDQSIKNCKVFWHEADRCMRRAVNRIADETGLSCHFVPSGFTSENGMFGSDCLLFYPWSIDPLMKQRASACTRAIAEGRTGVHCYLAAAFHPDARGAQRISGEVIKVMERNYEKSGSPSV